MASAVSRSAGVNRGAFILYHCSTGTLYIFRSFTEIYQTGKLRKSPDFKAIRKDGSILFAEVSAYPLKDSQGKIIGFWGISRGRTKEKKAELAIQKRKEQYRLLVKNANDGIFITQQQKLEFKLLQSQKMESIGTLVGVIAHEFKNILSSIIGFTELVLEDVEQTSFLADNLKEVLIADNRAKDLVHQILTFARQPEEKIEPVVLSTIAVDGSILKNSTQVHQIIMNLCTNAAQAIKASGGILSVDLTEVRISPDAAKKHLDLEGDDYRGNTFTIYLPVSSKKSRGLLRKRLEKSDLHRTDFNGGR